ncbi:hypothetical protein K491DRAFT_780583 [Lophiostoma macrostomum CBS 122681]|uniref:Uncharacterized protein n=1 Tax=Lophiostoma macrostomum CBS 122681 TaxID=1314788 RepID=A0A6A6SZC8_9PLEO|nr:hypothetical protein K491DRAFT_780583 [Lophiostoma macrostomum CBS 122681]
MAMALGPTAQPLLEYNENSFWGLPMELKEMICDTVPSSFIARLMVSALVFENRRPFEELRTILYRDTVRINHGVYVRTRGEDSIGLKLVLPRCLNTLNFLMTKTLCINLGRAGHETFPKLLKWLPSDQFQRLSFSSGSFLDHRGISAFPGFIKRQIRLKTLELPRWWPDKWSHSSVGPGATYPHSWSFSRPITPKEIREVTRSNWMIKKLEERNRYTGGPNIRTLETTGPLTLSITLQRPGCMTHTLEILIPSWAPADLCRDIICARRSDDADILALNAFHQDWKINATCLTTIITRMRILGSAMKELRLTCVDVRRYARDLEYDFAKTNESLSLKELRLLKMCDCMGEATLLGALIDTNTLLHLKTFLWEWAVNGYGYRRSRQFQTYLATRFLQQSSDLEHISIVFAMDEGDEYVEGWSPQYNDSVFDASFDTRLTADFKRYLREPEVAFRADEWHSERENVVDWDVKQWTSLHPRLRTLNLRCGMARMMSATDLFAIASDCEALEGLGISWPAVGETDHQLFEDAMINLARPLSDMSSLKYLRLWGQHLELTVDGQPIAEDEGDEAMDGVESDTVNVNEDSESHTAEVVAAMSIEGVSRRIARILAHHGVHIEFLTVTRRAYILDWEIEGYSQRGGRYAPDLAGEECHLRFHLNGSEPDVVEKEDVPFDLELFGDSPEVQYEKWAGGKSGRNS